MATFVRQSARKTLKVPDFAVFKFDVDSVCATYATRKILEATFVEGGRRKVLYKGKPHCGTIVKLGGKNFTFHLNTFRNMSELEYLM